MIMLTSYHQKKKSKKGMQCYTNSKKQACSFRVHNGICQGSQVLWNPLMSSVYYTVQPISHQECTRRINSIEQYIYI
jgi:hypothetical protein